MGRSSSKSVFKFKQFEVDQTGCAMKINTDGVLLAALTEADEPKRILDIGTGTGVIALMLAQRFLEASIEAVEIDDDAALTAGRNFQSSIFNGRLNCYNVPIEQYNNPDPFDLIISNPPYFVNDLRNTEEKKGVARHTDDHFFSALIAKIDQLLSPTGSFWFILPIKQAEVLITKAWAYGFGVNKKIKLYSDETKPAFRWIIGLNRFKNEADINHFYIYEAEKMYTAAYKELLKDFFIGF